MVAPGHRLQRIAQADQKLIVAWKEGVDLESALGSKLDELCDAVVIARVELAVRLLKRGDKLMRLRPSAYRDAISRHYYCLYHAFRSAAFFGHIGDDFEQHAKLPQGIPTDFPNLAYWRDELKEVRLARNRADYDLHPPDDLDYRTDALRVQRLATAGVDEVTVYLRSKGLPL